MLSALRRVDDVVGQLVTGLHHRGLYDDVNLILLADHGFAASPLLAAVAGDVRDVHGAQDFAGLTSAGTVVRRPGVARVLRAFAEGQEYEFRALHGYHPEDFSALAYTAYLWESRLHDRAINGLLVECFSQINPTAALRADLLPLWMPFNTQDSLEFFRADINLLHYPAIESNGRHVAAAEFFLGFLEANENGAFLTV